MSEDYDWTTAMRVRLETERDTLRAEVERLKEYHKDCLAPLQQTALLHEVERLKADYAACQETQRAAMRDAARAEAEVERLTRAIKDGMRVANALTLETQTPEEMATDLVRQVREARQQRDAAEAEVERLRAEQASWERAGVEALRDVVAENERLGAEVERLRGLIAQVEFSARGYIMGDLVCPWCECDDDDVRAHDHNCPAFSALGEVRR